MDFVEHPLKTMKAYRSILLSVAALLALATPSARAALVVTDGGFENPTVTGDNSFNQGVTNWHDSSTSWSSYVYIHSVQIASTSQVYGSEVDGGWIYQSLGTRSAGEDSIGFNFDAIERDRNGYGWNDKGLIINLYSGSFAGADGTDIDAALTSFGAIEISASDIFATPLSNTGADRETVNFTTSSIDLTGVAVGTEIWVRIETTVGVSATDDKAIYIDNFAIVPEPGAALLGGLGTLMLLMRRKRQPPFPRPPVRPNGSFRSLSQKANS